jgi:predicted nucleic acid-binding protein
MRRGRNPLKELEPIAMVRDVAICGVVRAEVGRGIREPSVLKKFHKVWDVMLNIPTDNRLWVDAEKTAWTLDRQGMNLPLTDIVIACCARRIGAVVLTLDGHFSQIPGVTATDRIV